MDPLFDPFIHHGLICRLDKLTCLHACICKMVTGKELHLKSFTVLWTSGGAKLLRIQRLEM